MATIQIGWQDKRTPMDTPVTAQQVIDSDLMRRARAHLSIERGYKRSHRAAYQLARHLRRLSARLPDNGALILNSSNLSSAPASWDTYDGLALEVWYCVDGQLQWDIGLYANGSTYSRRGIEWQPVLMPQGDATTDDDRRLAANTSHLLSVIARLNSISVTSASA